jgi:hypothetical protein
LGPVFSFYRKFIADLRYHNPHLKIVREITESGPLIARIVIKRGEESEPFVIEGGKYKTPDELKSKIVEYHNNE